ncbi:hypothetical protein H5410_027650 [Solanum commersonii]|uniref:DUF4283 domain-containing protein n=1 Tax=Solanum commersonii TaxID=4109 RepID=A0A9J5Z530_SOLCO|nr:hypothetical protein H5410_027650 [Solanum commersonii]
MMYDINDYMVKMSDSWKYTLIGKFYDPMPKMEVICKKFITQVELSGSVRITHFNSRHIYIDLDNELDRATVLDSKRLYIEGKFMRIHVWTPTFSPNLETLIVPIWVPLPELPWHYYYKEFVTHLLANVGKVIHLDAAFLQKTRGSFAKIASFYAKDSPKNVGHGETSDQDTRFQMIRTVDSEKDQTIPTDAEPLDPIIEVCYLNTSGNILEDDYMQVVFEDENDDISEEENDSPELTDDKHAHQLIETFGSSSQMQKVADEQGLSPRGTILLLPSSGTAPQQPGPDR